MVRFDVGGSPESDKVSPKRRNTGFVSTEVLEQFIQNVAMEEPQSKGVCFDIDVEEKVQTAPRKRNTGFVSAEELKKIMEATAVDVELSEPCGNGLQEASHNVAPLGRRNSYVSTTALQALIHEGMPNADRDTRKSCGEIYIPDSVKDLPDLSDD